MVWVCYLRLFEGTETVSCRLSLRMERMEMDWNLKKIASFFKVWCYVFKKSSRTLLWLALSDKIHSRSSSQLYRSILFMSKVSKWLFKPRIDLKRQNPRDTLSLSANNQFKNNSGLIDWNKLQKNTNLSFIYLYLHDSHVRKTSNWHMILCVRRTMLNHKIFSS